eukprot:gnl/Spiro4/27139_TR13496_c0_g7_i1.p1 gnl/Spiro4/27139_TR13496_c0_g7~~gnl/Spiro4/27139_TR13496_c0_g7_i1.p1  ORF type:complete len:633 (+),score=170.93 gnl/Spiro4/27139_TR13496_c0_g7_i1:88-1986(+)
MSLQTLDRIASRMMFISEDEVPLPPKSPADILFSDSEDDAAGLKLNLNWPEAPSTVGAEALGRSASRIGEENAELGNGVHSKSTMSMAEYATAKNTKNIEVLLEELKEKVRAFAAVEHEHGRPTKQTRVDALQPVERVKPKRNNVVGQVLRNKKDVERIIIERYRGPNALIEDMDSPADLEQLIRDIEAYKLAKKLGPRRTIIVRNMTSAVVPQEEKLVALETKKEKRKQRAAAALEAAQKAERDLMAQKLYFIDRNKRRQDLARRAIEDEERRQILRERQMFWLTLLTMAGKHDELCRRLEHVRRHNAELKRVWIATLCVQRFFRARRARVRSHRDASLLKVLNTHLALKIKTRRADGAARLLLKFLVDTRESKSLTQVVNNLRARFVKFQRLFRARAKALDCQVDLLMRQFSQFEQFKLQQLLAWKANPADRNRLREQKLAQTHGIKAVTVGEVAKWYLRKNLIERKHRFAAALIQHDKDMTEYEARFQKDKDEEYNRQVVQAGLSQIPRSWLENYPKPPEAPIFLTLLSQSELEMIYQDAKGYSRRPRGESMVLDLGAPTPSVAGRSTNDNNSTLTIPPSPGRRHSINVAAAAETQSQSQSHGAPPVRSTLSVPSHAPRRPSFSTAAKR